MKPTPDDRRKLLRARSLLTIYALRHTIGVGVIAAFVVRGLLEPDRRLGLYLLPALLAYAAFAGWTAWRLYRQLRHVQNRIGRSER